MKDLRKYCAEFIGTAVLVFFACGVAGQICTPENGTAGLIGTALAFGLVIVAMAYSIGNVSGCHINPAVSIAFLIKGDLSVKRFLRPHRGPVRGCHRRRRRLCTVVRDTSKLGMNALYHGAWFPTFVIQA